MFLYLDDKGPMYVEFCRTMRGSVSDGSGRTTDTMVPDPDLVKIKTRRETIMLGPGINEIAPEEFEAAKPSLGLALRTKKLRIIRPAATAIEPVDGKLREAETIADLSVDDAQKIVERVGIPVQVKDGQELYMPQVGNRDTLYRFLVEDARVDVQIAVKERLALLRLDEPSEDDLRKVRALLADEAA
jgi:hypothetical protein